MSELTPIDEFKDDRALVLELYRSGVSIRDIANKWDVRYNLVHRYLANWGAKREWELKLPNVPVIRVKDLTNDEVPFDDATVYILQRSDGNHQVIVPFDDYIDLVATHDKK